MLGDHNFQTEYNRQKEINLINKQKWKSTFEHDVIEKLSQIQNLLNEQSYMLSNTHVVLFCNYDTKIVLTEDDYNMINKFIGDRRQIYKSIQFYQSMSDQDKLIKYQNTLNEYQNFGNCQEYVQRATKLILEKKSLVRRTFFLYQYTRHII